MNRSWVAVGLVCLAAACGDKGGAASSGSSAADSSKPASSSGGASKAASTGQPAAPERKAKTTLTEKQLKEAYDLGKKDPDFKKHRAVFEEKLGKPMKEEGDKATWYGIKPAEGAQKESCFEVYDSPTKGDSSSGTDDSNCWEK